MCLLLDNVIVSALFVYTVCCTKLWTWLTCIQFKYSVCCWLGFLSVVFCYFFFILLLNLVCVLRNIQTRDLNWLMTDMWIAYFGYFVHLLFQVHGSWTEFEERCITNAIQHTAYTIRLFIWKLNREREREKATTYISIHFDSFEMICAQYASMTTMTTTTTTTKKKIYNPKRAFHLFLFPFILKYTVLTHLCLLKASFAGRTTMNDINQRLDYKTNRFILNHSNDENMNTFNDILCWMRITLSYWILSLSLSLNNWILFCAKMSWIYGGNFEY